MLYFFAAQAAGEIQAPGVPETPGIYFRQDDSSWIRLQPAVTADAGTDGLQLFVYTGGYTDLGMSIACPGPKAAVRISVAKPTLYARAVGSAKDAMLIRLAKKKDRRVCKMSFSNVSVGNKGGFRKEDIVNLISQDYPDGSFSVSPEKKLTPGEYLLVLSTNVPAYDFGVDRAK